MGAIPPLCFLKQSCKCGVFNKTKSLKYSKTEYIEKPEKNQQL